MTVWVAEFARFRASVVKGMDVQGTESSYGYDEKALVVSEAFVDGGLRPTPCWDGLDRGSMMLLAS